MRRERVRAKRRVAWMAMRLATRMAVWTGAWTRLVLQAAGVALLPPLVVGCAHAEARTWPALARTRAAWRDVRADLAHLRAASPEAPYVEDLTVRLHEPRTGRTFEGRGALAVLPGRALRMILVGPGGATALDVWATDDRFRVEVPAIALRRAGGGASDEAARGLPIGFFRWWMLHPLDGRLLAGGRDDARAFFVLRLGGEETGGDPSVLATALLEDRTLRGAHVVRAVRHGVGSSEEVAWRGVEATPSSVGEARYVDHVSGLRVDVEVRAVSHEPPDPDAFRDPDVIDAASRGAREGS